MYGYVAIAENLGMNKGFKLIEIIPTNESNTSLAAADFDLDGKLDVYVCCYAQTKFLTLMQIWLWEAPLVDSFIMMIIMDHKISC